MKDQAVPTPNPQAKGKILVFTAPSGAGKTTLVRHLLRTFPDLLDFSVSATTREARPHEKNGVDYYFMTPEDFRGGLAKGDFLEHEEVYTDQYYGTLHSEIARVWDAGKTIVFDVEVKGATAIKAAYPKESCVVFVAPPSPEILFDRLRKRGTESETSLRKRIQRAAEELTYRNAFDRVLVNDELDVAKKDAEQIVRTWLEL